MRSASEAATKILLLKVQSKEKEKISKRKRAEKKVRQRQKVVCQLVANVAATKWLAVQTAAAAGTRTWHFASAKSRQKSQALSRIITRSFQTKPRVRGKIQDILLFWPKSGKPNDTGGKYSTFF